MYDIRAISKASIKEIICYDGANAKITGKDHCVVKFPNYPNRNSGVKRTEGHNNNYVFSCFNHS